jgi:nitrogen fixation/metabolism regulation signal transduction histidine kinase
MKIKLDIENKILYPLLVLVVLPIIALGITSYYSAYQMLSERQVDHMDQMMENIKVIYEEKGGSLEYIKIDEDIYQLDIVAGQGFSPSEKGWGHVVTDDQIISYGKTNDNKYIVLKYDKKIFSRELFYFQKNSILIAIVSMLAAAQIIIILAFNISKPIKKLTRTCREIEEGRYISFEESYRKDELGLLANSFKKMMNTINRKTEKIEYLRDVNEKIIADAPIALFLIDDNDQVYKNNKLGDGFMTLDPVEKNTSLKLDEFIKTVEENEVYIFEDFDGNDLYLDVARTVIPDFGTIVSIYDITRRKEMESRMDHMNKLSSLGNVAASLAHEIRNPLSGIRAGMQVLQKRNKEDQSSLEIYDTLIGEVDRLNLLINDILNYSKPGKATKVKCSYREVLESSMDLYKDSMASMNVKVEIDDRSETVEGSCDPNQLKQIFINILSNALNAMNKDQKNLKVTLSNSRGPHGNKYLNIVFADNGRGIKKEDMDKIFDPFFTSYKKGVGLGLSVVSKLVNENNGKIAIDSIHGKGTEVKLKLEVTENE